MIDSHCHLDFKDYNNRREEVILEADRAGVHTLINIGVDLASSVRSVALADRFDSVYASVGIHPHDARTLDDDTLEKLKQLTDRDKVVAIGEIGLDFYRDLSPRRVQKQVFHQQLELAAELVLPVIIHTREAFNDTLAIVADHAGNLVGGVFHCFPGDINDARRVIDMGFIVSFGGVITYPNSKMSGVAAEVPLDKIILETDSPFLAPVPYRGKKNAPAYIVHVYEKLAELRGMSRAEVERVTDRTCRKLFRMVETFGG